MSTNPLEHIAFEDINDEYCYGKYGEFNVIMMKKNGYINATKLCGYISDEIHVKKQFVDWNRTQQAIELIEAVSSSTGYPVDDLTKIITGGQTTIIRGTYVHPKLIPHIASWASPKFAVKVADIVNKYFNKKSLKKKEKLIRKQKQLLGEKDDKIDELMKKVDKQSEEMEKQSAKIDKLLGKNKKMSKKLTIIKEQNEDISEQNEDLLQKVDTIVEDRVVKMPLPKHNPVFVVMKNPSKTKKDKTRYYAIRTKRMNVKRAINNYLETNEKATELLRIEYSPNSINLWDRVKERLREHIRTVGCTLTLKSGYTEEHLLKDITDINEEKYDV
jgi:hypothetical protein